MNSSPSQSDRNLIFWMCLSQVGSLLPLATIASLIPQFSAEWQLTNAEAGGLAGAIFVGYMVSVPFLMTATDRIDARLIFIVGTALSSLSALLFGIFAEGLMSGSAWRMLAGIGLAGCYMPGLRILTDRVNSLESSRGITSYTASYSIGTGLSFLFSGVVAELIGWRWMFILSAVGPFLSCMMAWLFLSQKPLRHSSSGSSASLMSLLDFRPVLRNRFAMSYIIAYTAHCYELAIFRSWVVAFLVFLAAQYPESMILGSPILGAVAITFIGLPASVLGNELALKIGRKRAISALMILSAFVGCSIGLSISFGPILLIALIMFYSVTVSADSGALTAGAIAAADPAMQGATMALHSTLGFGISFVSPALFGLILDLAGGQQSQLGWALAFVFCGLSAAFGPLALAWANRGSQNS